MIDARFITHLKNSVVGGGKVPFLSNLDGMDRERSQNVLPGCSGQGEFPECPTWMEWAGRGPRMSYLDGMDRERSQNVLPGWNGQVEVPECPTWMEWEGRGPRMSYLDGMGKERSQNGSNVTLS